MSYPSRSFAEKIFIGSAALLCLLAAAGGMSLLARGNGVATFQLRLDNGTTQAAIYDLEEAVTSAEQERGLSGRDGLGEHSGMLFAYDNAAERCMWMKDMKFAIDIIWLASDYRIARTVSSLSPDSYPTPYCAGARYVIELPAGTTARHHLKRGQLLSF